MSTNTTKRPARISPLEWRVLRKLKQLGTHSSIIAKALKRRKIRGVCERPRSCAIAKFIGRLPGITSVTVSKHIYFATDTNKKGVILSTDIPRGVSTFIDDFDSHRYPELEDVEQIWSDA